MDNFTKKNSTILEAIEAYLESVALSRSTNTARTYTNALKAFTQALYNHKLDPEKTKIGNYVIGIMPPGHFEKSNNTFILNVNGEKL